MMCRIDNYAQSINTENNTDAAVGTDDEETVLLMMKLPPASGAPVSVASMLSFGPSSLSSSPPSSPHHGKPSLSNHSKLQSSNHSRQTGQIQRRCFFSTRFKIAVFLTILLEGICLWSSGIDMLQSVMVNLASSIGVMQYESNIYSEHFLSFLDTGIRPAYFPFLLHGNTLLCPRVYREFMLTDRPRIKAAIEMISAGLVMSQRDKTAKLKKNRDPLPILIRNGDGSHCNTTTPLDGDGSDFPGFNFPRLTWAVPALKYHVMGCQAVPIPSYETWMDYSKKHTSEESWDETFALESKQYPWSNKTNVALWRGTTTANDMYSKWELNKIPRGRLVQLSMKHPALIDAGFVRLNQRFEHATFTKENATILTDRMIFDDMMKYKAIIDIDGNDWSSRFPKLLCMNSVVIKIEPDFIEYFYHELQPMVHFVPASLENLTQVAAYVLDRQNDEEMRSIVDSANSWCRTKMTKKKMAKDMMSQIEAYETMLGDYLLAQNITDESLASSLLQYDNEFVPCV